MKTLIFSFAIVFSGILLVTVCPTTSGRIELDEHVILLFTFDRDSGKTIKYGACFKNMFTLRRAWGASPDT